MGKRFPSGPSRRRSGVEVVSGAAPVSLPAPRAYRCLHMATAVSAQELGTSFDCPTDGCTGDTPRRGAL